jgi:myosin heavy subunit
MVGHTRLFLKYYHADQMEEALRKFYRTVINAQSLIRGHFARNTLKRLKERARMNAAERAAAEQRWALLLSHSDTHIYIYLYIHIHTLSLSLHARA